MRAVVARQALAEAVRIVSKASGGSLPITNGVRLDVEGETVAVTCTNLDLTIRCDVAMADGQQGSGIVPTSFLNRFLAGANGATATIASGSDRLTVESGDASISLRTFDVSEWPKVTAAAGPAVELAPHVVDNLRRLVGYAESDPKKPNPLYQGVCFRDSFADATDRYRLARADLGIEIPNPVTVPGSALEAVLRNTSGTVTLAVDDRLATFTSGPRQWTTRLIEGEYPKIEQLIRPSSPHRLTMNAERLGEAIRLIRIMAVDDKSDGVILDLDGGKAVLRNRETENGEVVDLVPCEGTLPFQVILRGGFLTDLIENCDDAEISFGFEDARRPLQVESGGLVQVVMPVQPGPKSA